MRWLVCVALLAACEKKAPKVSGPPVAKAIGSTGASIDAPPEWVVSQDGKITYRVGTGPGEQVFVSVVAFPSKSVDDLYASECARAKEPGTKDVTPGGAYFVTCVVPTTNRDGKALEITKVAAEVRIKEGALKCHFGSENDAAAQTAVCKSLRATVAAGGNQR